MPAAVADPPVGVGLSQAAPGLAPEQAHGHAGQHARQEKVLPAEDFPAELFSAGAGEAWSAEDSQAAVRVVGGAIAHAVNELFPRHVGLGEVGVVDLGREHGSTGARRMDLRIWTWSLGLGIGMKMKSRLPSDTCQSARLLD